MESVYTRACAYIDLDNVRFNMDNIKEGINNSSKIIAIIKTDGYGHGALPIARELEKLDYVWGYGVATAEEAITLKEHGIRKPVLIIGYSFPESYSEMLIRNVRLTVFKEDMLDSIDEIAGRLGLIAKVHIKVDTGMGRIGIFPDDSGIDFVRKVALKKNIEIEGIFTHFARADEADLTSARGQFETFDRFVKRVKEELNIDIPVVHCSNSAGIIEMPEANYDYVRAGIILYGMWPSDEVDHSKISIKPLLSLKSRIVYIKTVEPGTPISYGGTFVTDKRTVIATVPVGYGDGYPRSLSNKGHVIIKGQKANILGRICMDQFMCDVTDIEGVKEGDEVTLIGRDGNECITIEDIAEESGRLNYELACIIGKRIPRIYIKDGKPVYSRDFFDDVECKTIN